MVSLTHSQTYLHDCHAITDFAGTGNSADPLTGISFTSDGDYFTITGTCDAAADEWYYRKHDLTDFSSTIYNCWMARYKTSVAAAGLGAVLKVKYTDASYDSLVGSDTTPSFSTTWKVESGTLTTGKTVSEVYIYANDHPDSVAAGAFSVYFDFIMFFKGTFTLPNVAGGMNIDLPPKEAIIIIPGRDTNITQNLGTESAVVTIQSDLDQGTWKRPQSDPTNPTDTIDAEVFLEMLHNRSTEPFQWLDTGSHQFKVTVHPKFAWKNNGDGSTSRILDLILKEYSLNNKSGETYAERFGIGL